MSDEEARIAALEDELSEDERALLDELADGIVRRRLTTAAIFFLESVKPLGYVTSQAMIFFRPFVQVVWPSPVRFDRARAILERRGSIELLLRRLEARA